MRVRADQLPTALQKSLAPVYLISGDEPLQMGEAADQVRERAKAAGYSGRDVLEVETGFDWGQFGHAGKSLSMFSDRRILELRLAAGKLGNDGSAAVMEYIRQPPDDIIVLISMGKLASASQKTRWFKALDKVGVIVQVWPLSRAEIGPWLQRRAALKGMRIDREGLQFLAERVEGNLLAGAQEIDKLYSLYGTAQIDSDVVIEAVADSARFDVFKLVDSLLAGDFRRARTILDHLRGEGLAPAIVLWGLAREARTMAQLAYQQERGGNLADAYKRFNVWPQRKPLVTQALKRLERRDWYAILILCAQADRIIKGAESGDPWYQLKVVCAGFSDGDKGLMTKQWDVA